jgi:hypothetical protein
MDDERHDPPVQELARTADRLESLADTAELMGDEAGAARFRSGASQCRLQAMALLDGDGPPGPADLTGSADSAGSAGDRPADDRQADDRQANDGPADDQQRPAADERPNG